MDQRPKGKSFCATNKCLCLFLVLVVAAVAVVACITMLSPGVRGKHPPEETDLKWWQTTIIYQVYPRSFKDSDGDGTGDLQGIISKMSYFNEINVSAIWLSPFYKSPMRDFGYDVENYIEVDPIFGTMEDFENLTKEAHAKGLKVIIDFVPNHTSNESDWFNKSRHASVGDPFYDFYIWNDGKVVNSNRQPPNNWLSVFEGSAWEWDPVRNQYYYHAFLASQPDLNYRNERVQQEMDKVLTFWLDKGVDGFRIDAVPHLFEIEDQNRDESGNKTNGSDPSIHPLIKNRPEIYGVVKRWSKLIEDYSKKDGRERFLLSETVGIPKSARDQYYEANSVPFFFDLIPAKEECGATAGCFRQIIERGLDLPEGAWPNFVIGNHDNKRIADRMGSDYVDLMNMMLLTLPGTPTTYYGEELGMRGGDYIGLPPQDPYAITSNNIANSRDSERNPMQWDQTNYAGFTTCAKTTGQCPWLGITPNTQYRQVNVQVELANKLSTLSQYKNLAVLRQNPAFQSLNIDMRNTSNLLIYNRYSDDDTYMVILNFGAASTVLTSDLSGSEFTSGSIVASTKPKTSNKVDLSNIVLTKGEGLVIQLH